MKNSIKIKKDIRKVDFINMPDKRTVEKYELKEILIVVILTILLWGTFAIIIYLLDIKSKLLIGILMIASLPYIITEVTQFCKASRVKKTKIPSFEQLDQLYAFRKAIDDEGTVITEASLGIHYAHDVFKNTNHAKKIFLEYSTYSEAFCVIQLEDFEIMKDSLLKEDELKIDYENKLLYMYSVQLGNLKRESTQARN